VAESLILKMVNYLFDEGIDTEKSSGNCLSKNSTFMAVFCMAVCTLIASQSSLGLGGESNSPRHIGFHIFIASS
jgi:hypothetical protein